MSLKSTKIKLKLPCISELFAECADVHSPSRFIEQCISDICHTPVEDLETVKCDSFAHYARECSRLDVIVDWRSDELCRKYCFLLSGVMSFVASTIFGKVGVLF